MGKINWDELVAKAKAEGKNRKRPTYVETDLQKACVRWFDMQYPSLRWLMHHSPNEGKRSEKAGYTLKLMGMRAGFPDLILLMPTEEYNFLAVELKKKGSYQSTDEKEWQKHAEEHGGLYVVIRSTECFIETVSHYVYEAGIWDKKRKELKDGQTRGEADGASGATE